MQHKTQMRRLALSTISFLACLLSAACLRPQAATSLTSSPSALAVVDDSLSALGGREILATVASVTVSGTSLHPNDPTSRLVTWTFSRENHLFEMRREVSGPKGKLTSVSGHGKPLSLHSSGTSHSLSHVVATTSVPLVFPALLLAEERAKPQMILEPATQDSASVVAMDMTSYVTSVTMIRTWKFAPQSQLPQSVQYFIPSPQNEIMHSTGEIVYSDFAYKGGIAYPRTLKVFTDGTLVDTITVSEVLINSFHDSSFFDGK